MANLQVKNVPDSLHRRLKNYVRRHRRSLSDFVLEAVERELARREFEKQLAKRPATTLGVTAASLLEEERRQRDQELD